MKFSDYKITWGVGFDGLRCAVVDLIKDGWQPHDRPFQSATEPHTWYQVMVQIAPDRPSLGWGECIAGNGEFRVFHYPQDQSAAIQTVLDKNDSIVWGPKLVAPYGVVYPWQNSGK